MSKKNSYLILGVSESASEIEIQEAYSRLRAKYSERRYKPGEVGAEAAHKLTELDAAYEDIKQDMQTRSAKTGGGFEQIEQLIKRGSLEEAQAQLDYMTERSAEWHYLQSIIFYKKSWYSDSKTQLEFAVKLDPKNTKYSNALLRLNNLMSTGGPTQGGQTYGPGGGGAQGNPQGSPPPGGGQPQMGGCGTELNCCANLICLDCCCEAMGGDLIACC